MRPFVRPPFPTSSPAGVPCAARRLAVFRLLAAGGCAVSVSAFSLRARADVQGEGSAPLPADRVAVEGGVFRLSDVIAPGLASPFGAQAARVRDIWLASRASRTSAPVLDRWGRGHGSIIGPDGDTLQGALVDAGAARVSPESADRAFVGNLLAREAAARAGRAGLWSDTTYAVHRADNPRRIPGGFQMVEGAVTGVGWSSERIYINFGEA